MSNARLLFFILILIYNVGIVFYFFNCSLGLKYIRLRIKRKKRAPSFCQGWKVRERIHTCRPNLLKGIRQSLTPSVYKCRQVMILVCEAILPLITMCLIWSMDALFHRWILMPSFNIHFCSFALKGIIPLVFSHDRNA